MKKVVLIGDSIRQGYQHTVKRELAGLADVWSPEENSMHTVHQLYRFQEYVVGNHPDILHFNAGLWDLRNAFPGVAGSLVPLEHYRRNVAFLFQLAKDHTKAKVIWATTTPLSELHRLQNHAVTGHPPRERSLVDAYNTVANEEARRAGVEINDLHQFVLDHDPAKLLLPDGAHFTEEGCTLLGRRVAEVIRRHL
jgi:lysophospholipase L1-like esterase